MHVITVNSISVNRGGHQVFANLNWAIGQRDRTGLIGANGAGKSTLLKTMAGLITPDEGHIRLPNGIRAVYLPQEVTLESGHTLLEAACIRPPELQRIEAKLAAIESHIADPDVYGDMDNLDKALSRQARLLERWQAAGGPVFESTVQEILVSLGFTHRDFGLPVEALSGGQKKLVALTRLAAARPEVLLLDEPDNHLDLAAKAQLERFIAGYPGAVVLVSHDRYLLDEAVTKIAELGPNGIETYAGGYSFYVVEREVRRARHQMEVERQQKQIAHLEAQIEQFQRWGEMSNDPRHFRKVRSRRHRLERMTIIDPLRDRRLMDLHIEGGRGSTEAIRLDDLAMGFGDALLFVGVDLLVRHNQRVGLIGPNGAGKSVLMKLITGEYTPLEGRVRVGPGNTIGYYAQEHQTLSAFAGLTPIEMIQHVQPMPQDRAVALLLKFAFTYEQVRQPIRTMSGGERSRLQLLNVMLGRPNLLLLDEPTNHLDIQSAEVLEEALADFTGAMLVISHDRYFLDRVVDRLVVLADGSLTHFAGNYTEWISGP
ncbi:MAG: ABC-F family ATP-binding cassette domain-containing protein [Anaerolineae bacterium]